MKRITAAVLAAAFGLLLLSGCSTNPTADSPPASALSHAQDPASGGGGGNGGGAGGGY